MKTLIVIDMQKDFVTGVLGSDQAVAIIPNIKKKIEAYLAAGIGLFLPGTPMEVITSKPPKVNISPFPTAFVEPTDGQSSTS